MRSMLLLLSRSLFLILIWQGIIAQLVWRWLKTAAKNMGVFTLAWSVLAAQQGPPPPNGGNNNNQIAPNTQIKWPPSCMPPTGSGVYSPGGNACVPPGTAANAAGTQGQAQYNLDGHTFGASTSSFDPTTDTWYNDMAANKGPKIDATHKDFGVAAGCQKADKTGAIDMTCNITAAIAWGHAHVNPQNSPPNIYLPAGVYKVCGTLYLNAGDHLRGDSDDTTSIVMCPGKQTAIVLGSAAPNYGINPFPSGITDLTIVGQGSATTGTMVEVFAGYAYINHVPLYNHGGRGYVYMKSAERGRLENSSTTWVRWPITDNGANELYFHKDDALVPGFTAAGYCYNINCVNGVVPVSGNWYPDHHSAISLIGDNLVFEESSLKPSPYLTAMCYSGQIAKIAHIYTEGFSAGIPLVNASFQAGCYENNNKGTPLAQATGTGGTNLFVTDDSWMMNYVNETNLVTVAGFNVATYDIVPSDVLPGSSTPSATMPGVQQGQFERITVTGWGPDNKAVNVLRCLTGSTAPCTPGSNVGLNWTAGSLLYQVIGQPAAGAGAHLFDAHLNVASRGNVGAYTAMCNDQVIGQQCGEVIVGPVLDGVELNLPGSPAFSTTNWFNIRTQISMQNIFMSGWPGSGWPANTLVSGEVKVFTGGLIHCLQGAPAPPNAGQTTSGLPWMGQNTNNGCQNFSFPQYPNGSYPYAILDNAQQGMTASVAGGLSNVRDVFPYVSNGNQPGGKQFYDGYCFFDQGTSTTAVNTYSRKCQFGGPDNTAAGAGQGVAETIDTSTNNGINWSTQYKVSVDGAGHPVLFAGTRYFTITAGGGANSFALSTFGTAANQNLNMPIVTGMPSGGMGIVSKANAGAAGDAFDVATNDGVQLFNLAHNGNTILGPMAQGVMNNRVRNSYNLGAATWTTTGAPTITTGQTDGWGGTTATKIVATAATTLADTYTAALDTSTFITCAHAKGNAGGETIAIGAYLITGPTFTLTPNYAWYCSFGSRAISNTNAYLLTLPSAETIFVDGTLTVFQGPNSGSVFVVWTGALPLYMPTSGTAYPTPTLAMSQGNNLIAPLSAPVAVPFMQNLIITTGICTATGASYNICTNAAPTNWPSTFADTNYSVNCTGITPGNGSGPSGSIAGSVYNVAKTATGITPSLQTLTSSGFSYAEIDCIGKHN